MKKLLVSALLVLGSTSAFANVPKVVCSVMAYDVTSDGSMAEGPASYGNDILVGLDSKPVQVGFATLDSTLQNVCASDGGPCTSTYTLSTSLKIGDSVAYTASDISAKSVNFRQHLSVRAGLRTAFVNCDVVE